MGSEYINDFDYNNRTYRVFVQADQPFRMTARDLHSYYVRSDSGQMVPLDNLVTVTESSGPPVITHYNLFRAVEIDGSPAPGYSSGQGLAGMEELAKQDHDAGHELRVDRPDARRNRIQRQGAASSSASAFWSSISPSRRSTRASRCPSSFCWPCRWRCWARWAWSALRGLVERCLLPDRPGDADRPLGEELDSDCRVCRAAAPQGPLHRRCRHRGRRDCACGPS